ncbi:unnamed protein product [Didymodactylos carnosus]|nr:unnamed protein product [Didymodactylos carnosus]CAF4376921.1 unnamed protein product [Didymodactylos carnosus]
MKLTDELTKIVSPDSGQKPTTQQLENLFENLPSVIKDKLPREKLDSVKNLVNQLKSVNDEQVEKHEQIESEKTEL